MHVGYTNSSSSDGGLHCRKVARSFTTYDMRSVQIVRIWSLGLLLWYLSEIYLSDNCIFFSIKSGVVDVRLQLILPSANSNNRQRYWQLAKRRCLVLLTCTGAFELHQIAPSFQCKNLPQSAALCVFAASKSNSHIIPASQLGVSLPVVNNHQEPVIILHNVKAVRTTLVNVAEMEEQDSAKHHHCARRNLHQARKIDNVVLWAHLRFFQNKCRQGRQEIGRYAGREKV